jgi:hypothetical protein
VTDIFWWLLECVNNTTPLTPGGLAAAPLHRVDSHLKPLSLERASQSVIRRAVAFQTRTYYLVSRLLKRACAQQRSVCVRMGRADLVVARRGTGNWVSTFNCQARGVEMGPTGGRFCW